MGTKLLGELKKSALNRAAKFFCYLISQENALSHLTFLFLRFIWELVSPSRVYKVLSADEYLKDYSHKSILVKNNRKGFAAEAEIIGRSSKRNLIECQLPDLKIFDFSEVCIYHGSDYVVDTNKRLVINDYCANNNDLNKGYEDDATFIHTGKVAILKKPTVVKDLDSGIIISGKFSYNYYHNVYENLIKLLVVEDNNQLIPSGVPIIVDEEMIRVSSVKRIFEILSANLNRNVFNVKKGEMVRFKRLFYISPINSIVPVLFDIRKGKPEDCIFDREYTQRLRDKLLEYKDNGDYPKRFFITRKNTKHRNFNEEEVFDTIRYLGFQKVAPEEYSFEQQMALFHNAGMIIGGPGAAFTNLLFCESCVSICLYEETHYIPAVFSAPAYFNDSRLIYFLSGKEEKKLTKHTNSFIVDIAQFKQFTKEFIEPYIKSLDEINGTEN